MSNMAFCLSSYPTNWWAFFLIKPAALHSSPLRRCFVVWWAFLLIKTAWLADLCPGLDLNLKPYDDNTWAETIS